jgi:hypothetical protein
MDWRKSSSKRKANAHLTNFSRLPTSPLGQNWTVEKIELPEINPVVILAEVELGKTLQVCNRQSRTLAVAGAFYKRATPPPSQNEI